MVEGFWREMPALMRDVVLAQVSKIRDWRYCLKLTFFGWFVDHLKFKVWLVGSSFSCSHRVMLLIAVLPEVTNWVFSSLTLMKFSLNCYIRLVVFIGCVDWDWARMMSSANARMMLFVPSGRKAPMSMSLVCVRWDLLCRCCTGKGRGLILGVLPVLLTMISS